MSTVPDTTQPPLERVILRNRELSLDVLSYIPVAMVEKYQVASFEMTASLLKLAVVHPEQLKQGFITALKDIGKKVGKEIVLYQTDPTSLQELLNQYKRLLQEKGESVKEANQNSQISPEISKPPLFQIGQTVAYNYLRRVPLEYAREHRIISVDFLPPNTYWFAYDKKVELRAHALIPLIEEKNDIKVNPLPIDSKDFDELLSYYHSLSRDEVRLEKELKSDKPPVPVPLPPVENKEEESKNAEGVITPDLNATIISTEAEKGGLAGFFQRVGQSFNKPKKPESEDPSPAAAVAEIGESAQKINQVAATVAQNEGVQAVAQLAAEATVKSASNTPQITINPEKSAAPAPTLPVPPTVPVPAPAAPPATPPPTTKQPVANEDEAEIGKLLTKSVETMEELTEYIRKGFIPRIVAAIVSYAIHEKASDIHLEAFQDEVRVRYRVDGQLMDVVKLPPDIHSAMVSRIKILSRLRLDETRVPQDGRFDVNFEHAQVDLRVSVMPTVHGEKVVMRILDKTKGIVSVESLGIAGLAYENLTKAIQKPFGICLATGPTGSGKSTSLYAILNRIATPNVNVITLEDPVEYEMKGINQSQIRPKIGYTFAEGLRSVLRQDPNIIMVGEIRDGETANMATQAALTGHLVLSTLHTNDAAGAIPRLANMGIEPFLITSSLNVAVGQRLVRKICQKCKSEVSLPAGIQDQIGKDLEKIAAMNPLDAKRVTQPFKFYQGTGCEVCHGKGYEGRIGIYEVLMMSTEVEDLTLDHASGQQIQEQAQKEGMLTMYQDGLLKVIAGITTLDEVLRETTTK